jgi:Tfp pilus assembly protein PilF
MEEIKKLVQESLDLANKCEYIFALEVIHKVIKKRPDLHLGWYFASTIYATIENWNECYSYSKKANDLDPNNPGILNHLGVSLCELGNINEGLIYLNKGATLGDKNCYDNLSFWMSKI